MIIDITNSNLINIKEGDMIYSIVDNIQYKVVDINYKFDKVILRFDEDNLYEDLEYNTLDEKEYKIFREIIIN